MPMNNLSFFSSWHPTTPRRWKHRNSPIAVALRRKGTHKKQYYSSINSPVNIRQGNFMKSHQLSARKLAAGLWQLRFVELSGDHGGAKQNSEEKFKEDTKDKPIERKPVTILRSRNGLLCELKNSMLCIKSSKEEATKWDPALDEASNNFTIAQRRKLLEDRKLVGDRDSVVTILLEELLHAQRSINKLKAAHNSLKKKAKQLLQNLEEENDHLKRRERHKIEAMLDDLKYKLTRERRSRERMEALNGKLIHELAIANDSAKQFMTNYEKEKKERELTEEVCDELAKQLGDEKAKLEVLMWDSMNICKEVEEEREMMRMAEQWREARAQMKLADAKDVLEDKYNQMVKLIVYLQMFLRSKGADSAELDKEMEDVQLIKQAVESVNIQRIVELSYDFSNSDDAFPIKDNDQDEGMIRIEGLNKNNSMLQQSSPSSEDHKCSSGLHRINVNKDNNNVSRSEEECSEKEGMECPQETRVNVNGVSQWKGSKLLRLCPNGETMISNTKYSQHSASPSVEGSLKHSELLGQGNSTDSMNPHITRGMKGSIEWPRGIPKTKSKVIPLEERVKSQKSQLEHILKPKPY